MPEFAVTIEQWVEQVAKPRQDAFVRGVAMAALTRVKQLTPVVTGNLRASFKDYMPDEAIAAQAAAGRPDGAAITQATAGGKVFIGTAVAYAMRVEFGFVGTDARGRHYEQKGRGMVQQTVIELPGIAAAVLARVKAGGA